MGHLVINGTIGQPNKADDGMATDIFCLLRSNNSVGEGAQLAA